MKNALVMIVNRDGKSLFGVFLTDAMFIQLPLDLSRLWNRDARLLLPCRRRKFLVEDVFAEHHAVVANVNAGTGDKFFDLRV